MTKLSDISKRVSALAIAASVCAVAMAQSYYDDDIYYDASKTKTVKTQKTQTTNASRNVSGSSVSGDYLPADNYNVSMVNSRNVDVDTYNRRGQFLVQDENASENIENGDFTYTQRIERFHNPDVVSGSGDTELKEVYSYAMQQPQNINIYVIDNDPWNYYGPSWSWRYGNPWYWDTFYPSYAWGWGPSWNWSWTWGPSYAWGWGPSWSWHPGWGHAPGWHPAPGWGPAHAWQPSRPSWSPRPHNYVGAGSASAHRPGASYAPSTTNRPGNMGRGRTNVNSSTGTSTSRPGSYRPANVNNGSNSTTVDSSRPGNSGRGRSSVNNSNSNSNSNTRSSYNTYNSGSSSRSSSSGASFGGGGGSRSSHGNAGSGSSRGRR